MWGESLGATSVAGQSEICEESVPLHSGSTFLHGSGCRLPTETSQLGKAEHRMHRLLHPRLGRRICPKSQVTGLLELLAVHVPKLEQYEPPQPTCKFQIVELPDLEIQE